MICVKLLSPEMVLLNLALMISGLIFSSRGSSMKINGLGYHKEANQFIISCTLVAQQILEIPKLLVNPQP